MKHLQPIVSDKIAQSSQAAAFMILLFMAATETEYISFYVVCLIVAGTLILISNTQNTER